MKVHFIAIGGSVMHNMAIALKQKGYEVTGSDDEIFEPSASRLRQHGLFPSREGWNPDLIRGELDAVILGMHARTDNPELKKAQELGLPVYSYPEYIYQQSQEKKRIVIAGSHGKTTITSMVMHALRYWKFDFDYLVGAQLDGFDTMVKLTDSAPLIVLEGDEYLASPIDRRPKFHLYRPDIALISGISWDHINVFPTFENYLEQFRIFAESIPGDGTLIYCAGDENVKALCGNLKTSAQKIPYQLPGYFIEDGITCLETALRNSVPLHVFGKHNLINISGAREVCKKAGLPDPLFDKAISSFRGAAKRLELVGKTASSAFYKDFAHAPSKVKATISAMKEQYPDRQLLACVELHTFSSLNENFIGEYKGSMDEADEAVVYFNPKTIAHKKLKPIDPEQVKKYFAHKNLTVFTDSENFVRFLKNAHWDRRNLLLMTSGNFDGVSFTELASELYHS